MATPSIRRLGTRKAKKVNGFALRERYDYAVKLDGPTVISEVGGCVVVVFGFLRGFVFSSDWVLHPP